MKSKVLIAILAVLSIALLVDLVVSRKTIGEQKETISYHSNQLQQTRIKLDDLTQVHNATVADLDKRNAELLSLTNSYTEVLNTLAKTEKELQQAEGALKTSRDEVAARDSRIAALETQNKELDVKSAELSTAITNLTAQIELTQRKLASAEGDKALLQKELGRLLAEKAELERQMNDLAYLKTQVSRLKAELSIARRMEWIRQGLYANSDKKGASVLMENASTKTPPPSNYNLNVEINSDGSVKVLPSATNAPAAK
jgi:chromosome segregation ATPase